MILNMKLKLNNFGCHRSFELEIPDKGMILLSGHSGQGKSSILRAISYVFFGKINRPYTHGTTSCKVELDWTLPSGVHLNIIRTSKPSRLTLLLDGDSYEDEEAQGIISSNLNMDADTFSIISYCEQGTNSSLLSVSSQDQLSFLQELADVKSAENIYQYLKTRLDTLQTESTSYRSSLNVLTAELSKKSICDISSDIPSILDIEEKIASLRSKIKILKDEKISLDKSKSTIEGNIKRHKELIELTKMKKIHLASLKNRREHLQIPKDDREIEKLLVKKTEELKMVREINNIKLRRQNIDQLIADYFTDLSIQIEKLELHILPNDNDSAEDEISIEEIKDAYERFGGIIDDICRIFPQIEAFEGKDKIIKTYDLLCESTKDGCCFDCPSCGKSLHLCHEEIKVNYLHNINDIKIFEKLTGWRQILNADIPYLLYSPSDKIDQSSIIASRTNRIKRDGLKEQLDKRSLPLSIDRSVRAIEIDEERFKNISLDDEEISSCIEELRASFLQIKTVKKERSRLDNEITDIIAFLEESNSSLKDIDEDVLPPIITKISEIVDNLLEYSQELEITISLKNKIENIHETNRLRDSIASIQCKLTECQNNIEGIVSLREIVKKAELITLERVIDILNDTSSIYINEMFTEPMCTRITTVKELKTTKREKSQISTIINYKGSQYDNINQLSGGERQRVNLAFLIAMTEMVNSPIIMLDECINSLDNEMHINIINYIRKFSDNRLIVIVSHEAVEGSFDEVINLSS